MGGASSADVRSIQSPFRAGIEIEDYQLDPVVRAIQMPRVYLLIADDVGLGKTIEAGLVAARTDPPPPGPDGADRLPGVAPDPVAGPDAGQVRPRLPHRGQRVDARAARQRGIHVNPWTHFPRLITSIDFLKRERPMRLFREALPGPRRASRSTPAASTC